MTGPLIVNAPPVDTICPFGLASVGYKIVRVLRRPTSKILTTYRSDPTVIGEGDCVRFRIHPRNDSKSKPAQIVDETGREHRQ